MSLRNDFGTELIRNLIGLILLATGLGCAAFGAHWHMNDLINVGISTLIPAALLGFQSKRAPDGNTTTTSVTVPPPDVAAPITLGSKVTDQTVVDRTGSPPKP